ncbi:MAG: type II toxin-antitoxin system YafQ family toxin [Prevotellamassilia sp.]|nr:type II toxin-antitoxin system YafQ family toxin [Prevotellamassilia sp.]
MYKISVTSKFKKDLKRCEKRGLPLQELAKVLDILTSNGGQLPPQYRQHRLTGNYAGKWECHIKSDWLLVWEQRDDELILLMTDTGSHSDLFD